MPLGGRGNYCQPSAISKKAGAQTDNLLAGWGSCPSSGGRSVEIKAELFPSYHPRFYKSGGSRVRGHKKTPALWPGFNLVGGWLEGQKLVYPSLALSLVDCGVLLSVRLVRPALEIGRCLIEGDGFRAGHGDVSPLVGAE